MTINPQYMRRCLDLASLGRGSVGNGALVGAVLVRDDRIIAEGVHSGYGMVHAERDLLEHFESLIEPHDVLYVNLEPCCHQGKTPPCTKILIERGVKTVVYGTNDPDLRVAGNGIAQLMDAGVTVIGPLERASCERMNRGFISVRRHGRPWITIKKAQDSRGRISSETGGFLKITSEEKDIWSHTYLRARHDAILVGVSTIESDNPQLNTRFAQIKTFNQIEGLNRKLEIEKNSIQPYKIILDPHFRISGDARVISGPDAPRAIVISTQESLEKNMNKKLVLSDRGISILALPQINGHFDWVVLWDGLITPRQNFHGLTSILVEGGQKTWDGFWRGGVVDEEVILTSR